MTSDTTNPAQLPRKLDIIEDAIFTYTDPSRTTGRELFSTNLVLSLDIPNAQNAAIGPFITNLKKAWLALRYKHPSIALAIDAATKTKSYPALTSNEEAAAWANETVLVHEQGDPDVDFTFLGLPDGIKLHVYPKIQKLLLRSRHWIIDFIGSLMLSNDLLTFLSRAQTNTLESFTWGQEGNRLLPPLENGFNLPREKKAVHREFVEKMYGAYMAAQPTFGAEYNVHAMKSLPGATKSCRLVLSRNATDRFLAGCKGRGWTVTVAVHTALAIILRELSASAVESDHFGATAIRDLRRYLGEPFNGVEYAVACAAVVDIKPLTVPFGAKFSDIARHMKEFYHDGFKKDMYIGSMREHRDFSNAMVAAMVANPPDEVPSDVTVSSVGVLEKYVKHEYGVGTEGSVGVRDVRLLVEMPRPTGALYIYTWGGQLSVSPCWCESFYEEEFWGDVIGRTYTLLGKEFGFELDWQSV